MKKEKGIDIMKRGYRDVELLLLCTRVGGFCYCLGNQINYCRNCDGPLGSLNRPPEVDDGDVGILILLPRC